MRDRKLEVIGRLRRPLVERNAVDGVDQRAQQGVAGKHEDGQRHRLRDHVCAGARADRGRRPQRRRGVEAAHVHALLHDDAGAEETDAGDDIGDHPHRAFGAGQMHREIDEGGRADRDQYIGAQTGGALPVLPLGADQRAEHERREQADQRVDEIGDLECREKPHVRLDKLEK